MEKPRALSCNTTSILNPVIIGHEISRRSNHSKLSRQDSQLSVKTLIESIENATKQAKTGIFFFYNFLSTIIQFKVFYFVLNILHTSCGMHKIKKIITF